MNRFLSRLFLVFALLATFSMARASSITLKLDDGPTNGPTIFAVGADVTGTISVSGMLHPAVIRVAIDANHSVTLPALNNNEVKSFAISTKTPPPLGVNVYTVTATNTEKSASTPDATAPLSLTNSARLQYQRGGAWLELPGIIYQQRGSDLALRAVPASNPVIAFPNGNPTWSTAGAGATVTAGAPISTATAHFATTSTTSTDFKLVGANGIGANVRPAKVVAFGIAITLGASTTDISEPQANPQSVMAGQKIDLKTVVTPTTLADALIGEQWNLGTTEVVKGYNFEAILPPNLTDDGTQVTKLPTGDMALAKDHVSYYFNNGNFAGQDVTVSFTGTINDSLVAATVKFKVFRPRIATVMENGLPVTTFEATLGIDDPRNDPYVGIAQHPITKVYTLRLGGLIAGSAGIDWTATVETPPGMGAGEIGYTQLINIYALRRDETGAKGLRTSNGKLILDNGTGEALYGKDGDRSSTIGNGGTSVRALNDTPEQEVFKPDLGATREDSFALYLIYKPSGVNSIWTTVGVLNWRWDGFFTRDVVPALIGGHPLKGGTKVRGAESHDFPTWSDTFSALKARPTQAVP